MGSGFIELTAATNGYQGPCWVNVASIREIRPADVGALISYNKDEFLFVSDTPEDVLHRITNARIAIP
jgi:hypothetical protein